MSVPLTPTNFGVGGSSAWEGVGSGSQRPDCVTRMEKWQKVWILRESIGGIQVLNRSEIAQAVGGEQVEGSRGAVRSILQPSAGGVGGDGGG